MVMSILHVNLTSPWNGRSHSMFVDLLGDLQQLKRLIESSFFCSGLVGVRKSSTSVIYPLSMILQIPHEFQGKEMLELVISEPGCGSCAHSIASSPTLTLPEAIEEARYLLGSEHVDIASFLSIANSVNGGNPMLSKEQFVKSFQLFHKPHGDYQRTNNFKLRQANFIEILFDSLRYDTSDDSVPIIGVRDVLSLLSVLCVDRLAENLDVVFSAYDSNNCGYISEFTLLSHLYVVFSFLFKLSHSVRDQLSQWDGIQGDPRRFARGVWKSLMTEFPAPAVTSDGDGVLFAENFVVATEHLINNGYGGLLFESSLSAAVNGFDEIVVDESDITVGNLTERRMVLGLDRYSATFVLDLFGDVASSDGIISLSKYHRCIAKLVNRHYNSIGPRERAIADLIIHNLFQLCDKTGSGFCNLLSLGPALSVYCGGDSSDKARALVSLVQLYADQKDQQQRLPLSELSAVLSIVFQSAMMLDDIGENYTFEEATFDTLAVEISLVCRRAVNKWVSQKEFEDCIKDTFIQYFGDSLDASEAAPISVSPEKSDVSCGDCAFHDLFVETSADGDYRHLNREKANSFDEPTACLEQSEVVQELRSVQQLLGLSHFAAEDLIETFGDYSTNGVLDRESFCTVMHLIARLDGISIDREVAVVDIADRLYNLFESEDEPNCASYAQLTVGLSCLCSADFQEKLLIAFTMLDDDQDGYLSKEQLFEMMLSVLRVVSVCSPTAADKVTKCNFSLEMIAAGMTTEAMLSINRNKFAADNKFSLAMVTQIAQDCMDLAENVSNLSSPHKKT